MGLAVAVGRRIAITPTGDVTMKKVQLKPEELRVESFPTAAPSTEGGTVRAHGGTLAPPSCPAPLCQTYDDTVCGLTQACG